MLACGFYPEFVVSVGEGALLVKGAAAEFPVATHLRLVLDSEVLLVPPRGFAI